MPLLSRASTSSIATIASKLRTGGNDVKSGLATTAISRIGGPELAVRHGVDPDQHSGPGLHARAVGLVETAGHLHRAQVRQLGDRRAKPHTVAAPEFGRRPAHRSAGAHVGHQRDGAGRGRAQREQVDDALRVGDVELRLVALLAHDRDVGFATARSAARPSAARPFTWCSAFDSMSASLSASTFETSSARPRSRRAREAADRACASSASTACTRRAPSASAFSISDSACLSSDRFCSSVRCWVVESNSITTSPDATLAPLATSWTICRSAPEDGAVRTIDLTGRISPRTGR